MSSPGPLEYGKFYHIYNRGNNRESIFLEDGNYTYFLQLYVKYIEPVACTYAYCLLRNHFHLLIRTKTVTEQEFEYRAEVVHQTREADDHKPWKPKVPSEQFSHLFNAYAKAINKRYNRSGTLFEHPFGRLVIDEFESLKRVMCYIHRNPLKHGFVQDFRQYVKLCVKKEALKPASESA
jgi:putative transposase